MKRTLLLLCAACDVDTTDPPWSLDHDRVVAARAEPPHVAPGEIALLDALVAHAGGSTTVERPISATAPSAPAGLSLAVHFYFDRWQVDGPDETALVAARAELGLPDGVPVPLDVIMRFPGELFAQKTVWLGDRHENPPAPPFTLDAMLDASRTYSLDVDVPAGWTVRWLASCGSLADDTTPHATLSFDSLDGTCDGEIVVVVRDPAGGTTWHVVAFRAT